MPDVNFRLPKGAGQQRRGLIQAYRYGLFAPGKSRIVIDTKGPVRVEAGAMVRRPGSMVARLNIDLAPTDRASFLAQAAAARAAAEGDAGARAGGPRPLGAQAQRQAHDRHRRRPWRGRSRRGQW